MSNDPGIAARLPHRPPMLMLTEVVNEETRAIHARATIAADNPLLDAGLFPAFAAIEPLAQACGLLLGGQGAVRPGAIVQIKTFTLEPRPIPIAAALDIHARYQAGSADAALFDGEVTLAGQAVLSASLMIAFLPGDADET